MTREMPFHKRYHAEALRIAEALTLEEVGAYNLLGDKMFDLGGPIPDNARKLAGLFNVSVRKAKSICEQLIEKGHLVKTEDDKWSLPKVLDQIEEFKSQAETCRVTGAKGGRKRAENAKKAKEFNAPSQGSLEDPFKESRNENLPDTKVSEAPPPLHVFDLGCRVLADAGVGERNARALIGKWRKDIGDAELTNILHQVERQRIAEPAAYISKIIQSRSAPSSEANRFFQKAAALKAVAKGEHHGDT